VFAAAAVRTAPGPADDAAGAATVVMMTATAATAAVRPF
jgi:hypothetical protein